MKKVYTVSSLPITRCSSLNKIPNLQKKQTAIEEIDQKSDIKEIPQDNIHQYRVITVPVHKIKILNIKRTELHSQNPVKVSTLSTVNSSDSNLMYNLLPVNNASNAIDNKDTNLTPKSNSISAISTNKRTSKFQNGNINQVENNSETQLISPSSRWLSQPKSYRGPKKDYSQRKAVRKISVSSFVDTTDGETSGMGSSVDEPVESSTESASEASTSFLQPRLSLRPMSISPSTVKKRRGGWPKGRKRKPEPPGTKAPKAPLTAYVLFLNERRKFYKETHPHLPFVEVTKLLGAEWSSMTQAQKAIYVTHSEQDKKRYRNELHTYRQSHDYQILLRKKRIKNAMNRGQTTEESSDFTDEVDDDDSEELHCRTCDQWFSSLHNKREHLYGKPHLQAITGEYQREREAEEKRRSDSLRPSISEEEITIPKIRIGNEKENEDDLSLLDGCSSRRDSIGVVSTTEDDRDDDDDYVDDEEEEDSEYDDEGEVTEEEGSSALMSKENCESCSSFSERVTDAAEGVINKVINREMEIRFLRNHYEKSRRNHRQISAALATLQAKQKLLQEQQKRLLQEEEALIEQAMNLTRISEFCKNGIQFCNSDKELDNAMECRNKWSLNSDNDPFLCEKFTRGIESFNQLSSPALALSSVNQELSGCSVLSGSKIEKVLTTSDREVNNPLEFIQFSLDFNSTKDPDKAQIQEEIEVSENNAEVKKKEGNEDNNRTKREKTPLYQLYKYKNAFGADSEKKDSVISQTRVEVAEPALNNLNQQQTSIYNSSFSSDYSKNELDHSYSKINSTSVIRKKIDRRKVPSNVSSDQNLELDPFGRIKDKCYNEMLKPPDNCIENIEHNEPSSTRRKCQVDIYKKNYLAEISQLNASQSHFPQNTTPTLTKLGTKKTMSTNSKNTFHSIKDEPPNIKIDSNFSLTSSDTTSKNDVGNGDNYFSTESSSLEESCDLDYIDNFMQEDIGFMMNPEPNILPVSDDYFRWQEESTAQKLRYHNFLNCLPSSLDNIFEEDDSVGNFHPESG